MRGFATAATSSFCFGKRNQNHVRPSASLRVPSSPSRIRWRENSLHSNSSRQKIDSERRRSRVRRRRRKECDVFALRNSQQKICPQRSKDKETPKTGDFSGSGSFSWPLQRPFTDFGLFFLRRNGVQCIIQMRFQITMTRQFL